MIGRPRRGQLLDGLAQRLKLGGQLGHGDAPRTHDDGGGDDAVPLERRLRCHRGAIGAGRCNDLPHMVPSPVAPPGWPVGCLSVGSTSGCRRREAPPSGCTTAWATSSRTGEVRHGRRRRLRGRRRPVQPAAPRDRKPLISKTISTVVATTVAYAGNRVWTFRRRAARGRPRVHPVLPAQRRGAGDRPGLPGDQPLPARPHRPAGGQHRGQRRRPGARHGLPVLVLPALRVPRAARSRNPHWSAGTRSRRAEEQREDGRFLLDQLEAPALGLGELTGHRQAQPGAAPAADARSKMRAPNSGGTPGPSSVTSTTSEMPVERVDTVTLPPPCVRLFSSRVASTCDSPLCVARATRPRVPVATMRRFTLPKAGSHSTTCCRTTWSSGTGPARMLLSRTLSSRCSTTATSRSTWASALRPPLSRCVGRRPGRSPRGASTARSAGSAAGATRHWRTAARRRSAGRSGHRCG